MASSRVSGSDPDPYLARDVDRMLGRNVDPVDAAIREAGLIVNDGPVWDLAVNKSQKLFRWHWALRDIRVPAEPVTYAEGYAWSKNGAHRKAYRAHVAVLTERVLNRGNRRDRRQDGLGCE